MSLAAAMYYTGLNPLSKDAAAPIYVAVGCGKSACRRRCSFTGIRRSTELAREALLRAGRP